jgi:hypothetical protein
MNKQAPSIALALRNRPELFMDILKEMGIQVICERPGCEGIVQHPTPSMTGYSWDGKGEDPNRDLLLCYNCSCEHIEQMTAQWEEYKQNLL